MGEAMGNGRWGTLRSMILAGLEVEDSKNYKDTHDEKNQKSTTFLNSYL